MDYPETHNDNREFALFRDTCWTEHVCVQTYNASVSSHGADFVIGDARTIFGCICMCGECGQYSIVYARNFEQGGVLLRADVSDCCSLRTIKQERSDASVSSARRVREEDETTHKGGTGQRKRGLGTAETEIANRGSGVRNSQESV